MRAVILIMLFNLKQVPIILVSWVVTNARLVAFSILIITLSSAAYTYANLGINTDTEDMLSPNLPFRQNSANLSKAFPQFSDNIVIVVDAPTADQTDEAANLLSSSLKARPSLFGEIFDPGGDPFFKRNGLLYLDIEELEKLTIQLANAQPFLGRLNISPSLPELFNLIGQILKDQSNTVSLMSLSLASRALRSIAKVMESQINGSPHQLSWRDLIATKKSNGNSRIIVIQPKTEFFSLQPGTKAINAIRRLVADLNLKDDFDAKVRLTGSLALSNEELQSVLSGLGLAGLLSMISVIALLYWCLRSIPLLIATLATLISGLILTAGFAAASVGTLNLISVAFAILFIGLSVDFGIHYCLRYQEQQKILEDNKKALATAAMDCGKALALVAIAAAVAFYSFLPTDYLGLSELGQIAGSGMLIALLINFTLLPALITLLPKTKPATVTGNYQIVLWSTHFQSFRRTILTIAVLLGLIGVTLIPWIEFNFDPLKLKDPQSESVSTLLDIMSDSSHSPYSIIILNPNLEEADRLATKMSAIPNVKKTYTLSNLIPNNQEDKLELIENLSLILSPALQSSSQRQKIDTSQLKHAFSDLDSKILETSRTPLHTELKKAVTQLASAMSRFKAATNLSPPALFKLQSLLLDALPSRLNEIRLALTAKEILPTNLPTSIRTRLVSRDGRAKLEVYPAGNIQLGKELRTFVTEVREIAPNATGAAVIILEAGKAVVTAFIQAGGTTVILIAILIVSITRNPREIILIFGPLALAALLTGATTVVFSVPFNFANLIVLPLLFGLGIAGNIHMVLREKQKIVTIDMINSTTPRAVGFSALTTIGSFGSLVLSGHPGTSSMGILLTIAIITSLICTLVLLPNLMRIWPINYESESDQ